MQSKPSSLIWSSVGKKVLMAVTGLSWIGFVTMHLLGNLTLFVGADTFNLYSHKLISLGPLLWVAEAGLVIILLTHIVSGLSVTLENWRGRTSRYAVAANAGGASYKTFSSRTMIYTGSLILLFIVIHVWMFKYGPEYKTTIHGTEVRDLYRLIAECFQQPLIVVFYVVSMIFLGLHLRHGFWSAFQTLGLWHKKWTPVVYAVGTFYAILFSLGFIILPVWVYFAVGGGK